MMTISLALGALLFFLIGILVGSEIVKPKQVDGVMVFDDTDPDIDKIELKLDTDPNEVDIYILKVERTRHK
jgi:hypothetical protein